MTGLTARQEDPLEGSITEEVQGLRNAISKVDASRDAVLQQLEELHDAALRAFQATTRDIPRQIRDSNPMVGREFAIISDAIRALLTLGIKNTGNMVPATKGVHPTESVEPVL